jgi:hypothetical protein
MTLFSAVLYVATVTMVILQGAGSGGVHIAVVAAITIAQAVVWSYVLLRLRDVARALNTDPAVNRYVVIVIAMTIATAISWSPAQASGEDLILISLYFSLAALTGIAYILLGACLLRVRGGGHNGARAFRLFAWMAVASGFCMMVVVTLVVAVPFYLAAHGALWSLFKSYEA